MRAGEEGAVLQDGAWGDAPGPRHWAGLCWAGLC